ncbi:MAG: ABC transporter ATP-binding protein/permease [Clostridiaceae bacterium]|jgi:ABC-type multidrug transport system fused ATPase/permease subunit|nr:ABC transporter ATP-binding protein/permease [Clostridiaceae bacterium]
MILKYLFRDKAAAIALLFIYVLSALMVTGLALVYGNLVNVVANGANIPELLKASLYSLAYTVIVGVLFWLKHYYGNVFFARFYSALQNEYFKKIINSNYGNISQEDSSKYFTAITNDVARMRANGWMLYDLAEKSVAVVSSFIAAVILNWEIGLIMLALTAIMGILPLIIKKRLDKQTLLCSDVEKIYSRSLKENLQGAAIIKSFSAEGRALKEVSAANNKLLVENKKKSAIDAFAGGAGVIVQNISILALVGLTCYFVIMKKVEIGAVLSIVQIGMGFYGGMLGFASTITYYMGSAGVRKRVFGVLNKADDNIPAKEISFSAGIALKNVSFSYPDKERAALDKVNLELECGKKYLILGKSGSGKSTVLKLMAKFYDVSGGEILIDGKSYSDLRERDIAKIVSVALQSCYLFNRSFRENIDYLGENDEEKLERVIEFCALKDFVATLPQGFDTVVDEEVNQVSGGEKLRINLARALYRESKILLLDEVTSALDKNTANIVETNLLSLEGKTVVNVCHKFNDSTLPLYDKIFIIEDGNIVESGSYGEIGESPVLYRYRSQEGIN